MKKTISKKTDYIKKIDLTYGKATFIGYKKKVLDYF